MQMKMNNLEIRREIERKRLKYYEVASALNVNVSTLSRWLQEELPEDRKHKVLRAIKSIKY